MAVAVIGRPSLFIVRTHARPGVHTLLHSALFVPAVTVSPALEAYALNLSTQLHSPGCWLEGARDDGRNEPKVSPELTSLKIECMIPSAL